MGELVPADIREIAAAQIGVVSELVAGLSDADLAAPTACPDGPARCRRRSR